MGRKAQGRVRGVMVYTYGVVILIPDAMRVQCEYLCLTVQVNKPGS